MSRTDSEYWYYLEVLKRLRENFSRKRPGLFPEVARALRVVHQCRRGVV
jgi:hypothetical protein